MRNILEMASGAILSAALAAGCGTKLSPKYEQVQETVEVFAKRICNTLGEGEHVTSNVRVECNEHWIFVDAPYYQSINMRPDQIKLTLRNTAEYIRNKRVVVAGEYHNLKNDNDAFLELLPIFKREGFTDLAIELDIKWQEALDQYTQSGDEKYLVFLDSYMGGEGLQEIIKLARSLGFKCTCIDMRYTKYYPDIEFDGKTDPQAFTDRRDQYMFENIEKILQSPDRRVVCFNGLAHATYDKRFTHQSGEDHTGPILSHINEPLGYRLRKKYSQEGTGLIDLTGCAEDNHENTYACFESTRENTYYQWPVKK